MATRFGFALCRNNKSKKACYMIVNNRRLGSKGYIVAGRDSEFLTLNGVDKYRDILIF